MVCKDELCASFKNLRSADRIDLLCGLFQLCVPLELRFIGSYLEELARKDYGVLKEFETKANDYVALRETRVDELTRDSCGTLNIYMSLVHSDNSICAHVLFDILARLKSVVETTVVSANNPASEDRVSLDFEMVDDIILLFTMALHHPAFTFSQRLQLYKECKNLKSLLSNSTVCIPMKNGSEEEERCSGIVKDEEEDEVEDQGSDTKKSSSNLDSTLLGTESEPACIKELSLKSMNPVEGKMEFVLEVTWSDASVTKVTMAYQELHEFHRKFVHLFPNYSGAHKQERLVPFFPQENNKRVVELMKDYFRKFSSLPESCLRCEPVMDYFHSKRSTPSLSPPLISVTSAATPFTSSAASSSQSSSSITSSSTRNGIRNSCEATSAPEEDSEPRANRIRSLTVYNSHLGEHSTKRGGETAGKPLRPHVNAVTRAPVVSMTALSAPVPRHPWLSSQSASFPLSARLSDGGVGCQVTCSSPSLSVKSHCTSPQPSSISPPQSTLSNSSCSSSPVELPQLQGSALEPVQGLKHFHRHHDPLVASTSGGRLHVVEPDDERSSHQHSLSLHKSKSEQDHRWIVNSNGVPPGVGGIVSITVTSAADCQPIEWCLQSAQEPPPIFWNSPSNIPKVLPPGLHPVAAAYVRPEAERRDVIVDQDKTFTDDLCSLATDGAHLNDRLNTAFVSQHLAMNPANQNQDFNPASMRTFPVTWDPSGTHCYFVPSPLMKSGLLMPVATQPSAATKPARPILGASHHRTGSRSQQQTENGEKRCTTVALEAGVVSTKAVTTTAVITVTTHSQVLGDSGQLGEPVGNSLPVLVSTEGILSRPSSLSLTSTNLSSRRLKMMSSESKASNFRISGSRSVATVSSSADSGPRGMAGFYSDVNSTVNSGSFPAPGAMMMQRMSSLPSAASQSFPVPPSVPMMHSVSSMTPAIPTPSTTPPILPIPLGNSMTNGGQCATCCQCVQCSVQTLAGVPYSYPLMWPAVYPNAFSFVNGFFNAQSLSFPPPSLPPHVQVAPSFNGISSEMMFNISQPQAPGLVPPAAQHLNHHPPVMGSPLFTSSQCVPFHPSFPPPIHIRNMSKPKLCCPNCGANDHLLGACTEAKASVLGQTAQFRLNMSTKQPTD